LVTNFKFDGYRALGVKAADKVRLFRNGKDFTRRFASIASG
jgi:ATP-dependent DNA ligase